MQTGTLKLKIQILCGDEIAMGPGKADLLDAIALHGSISAAGRALGMSYRRSWLLVDTMNRCWNGRLVETVAGGGRDRGARVTEAGQAVLAAYRALEQAALTATGGQAQGKLDALLRPIPLPAPLS
ncbi:MULTISPECIES: winged helix-turn-helix domain-containing protein [Sphingobium]|jgi:molybdate transport system regulatory protein|uniref:LysR family transcriptional regulator n=1 Tax=Sphingobium yanoikuyae TaxID=13690 RepID=A0A085KA01_SPHYA|nr:MULTISPECIES: LysR family transcriptional regulator [Sphingobium]AYO77524.1 LysR family transcriptional regulator [Sphingobium yanoikuyae]KFD29547.1 ModE family transcriptional regulator [Sphingobium yanoikuyae]KZC80281.1 ModE family transcriptional regulator [Sphingobium yanoikuyae]MDV3479112.1 LysR family transcriptional regulator [Sphingobium yanoikuyae]QCB38854.1 LysR family transcriptional regulator [Sphingobium sp. PAMC28499]